MKFVQIISSCNRPAQLDLLLRSIRDNLSHDYNKIVYVLWKATEDFYREGYQKVIKSEYGFELNFIQEHLDYKIKIMDILNTLKGKYNYVLMNSDDNVFINNIDYLPNELESSQIAFSLRMGDLINYCLPARLEIKQPNFIYNLDFIEWKWTDCDRRGAYGYPQPYDSNIYRRDWLIEIIKNKNFTNPYSLENVLNANRDNTKPYMISFKQPKLINIMANTTGQNNNPNMKGKGLSIKELNNKWLQGFKIKTDRLYGMNPTQAHIYYNYEFERE